MLVRVCSKIIAGLATICCLASAWAADADPARSVTFETDIQPILMKKCGACHSASGRAGLDIRTIGSLRQGGHSGAAIHVGSPNNSLLVTVIVNSQMPPKGMAEQVTPAELKLIKAWIASGAHATGKPGGHWAFTPPNPNLTPPVPVPYDVQNPVDRFLLTALKKRGLSYSHLASPRVRVRRLFLDLIGELPSNRDVEEFEASPTPESWERLVDRLLQDPRYGERQARHWLDTAGYADSEGILEEDRIRPNAYRYRDYVIKSLNKDLPYDQFLREQIAGDEMSHYRKADHWSSEIDSMVTATGFLRTAVDATRDDFNTHQFTEYQYRMLHDTQTILISTTLGITLQCARCHDHKYEPFTQKDYYGIQAILNGAIRPEGALLPSARRQIVAISDSEKRQMDAENAAADRDKARAEAELDTLRVEYLRKALTPIVAAHAEAERSALLTALSTLAARQTAAQKALIAANKGITVPSEAQLESAFPDFKRGAEALRARISEATRRHHLPAEIRAIYDQDSAPPPSHILLRGEYTHHGEALEPDVPAVLKNGFVFKPSSDVDAGTTGRRLSLARWIASKSNPLTARVEVNRIWYSHFGEGIVATLDNFGQSGAAPTNPPLLDWLSVQFTNGIGGATPWSRKPLHRLICTSLAYQQASGTPEGAAGAKIDPENRLLWRQRPHRMDAETLRDTMLQVSGDLDATMYGEPVTEDTRSTGEVAVAGESSTGRRSIYLLMRRSKAVSFLNAFDAPVIEVNCTRRASSSTAVQALAALNGSFTAARAAHLAKRVPGGADNNMLVQSLFEAAYQRAPSAQELKDTLEFLAKQTSIYTHNNVTSAAEARTKALEDCCLALLSSNEFMYVD
jgi:Protein of unknown function (DUF1553)/Protein of unknown function (DUF1549)/Planctomycete cytochrome C